MRQETNKVVALARKDRDLGQPPVVAIEWGAAPLTGSDFPFVGVVSQLAPDIYNVQGGRHAGAGHP